MKKGFQRGISLPTVMLMLIGSMPVGVWTEDVNVSTINVDEVIQTTETYKQKEVLE